MTVQCSCLEQSEVAYSKLQGFKIVCDNIDKNILPSYYERLNSHTISLHYLHSYAALDRIDLSGVSDAMKGYFQAITIKGRCITNKVSFFTTWGVAPRSFLTLFSLLRISTLTFLLYKLYWRNSNCTGP